MISQIASDKFLKSMERLEYGALNLVTPEGRRHVFEGKNPGIAAELELRDWRVISRLAAQGDVAFADDYKRGLWDSRNLQNLIALGLQNDRAIRSYIFGSPLSQMVRNISYLLRLNTLKGSRRNIHAHYDLGNDFYKLWLDPTMTYSSALYKNKSESLAEAQNNKYDRIIDTLQKPSGRLLEIGCGWGGFAERAHAGGDFEIKAITLSEEQHRFARERLNGAACVALEDYRNQQKQYDHIVSIEMFEAVGERYWPVYFSKIKDLLAAEGRAVIQTITISESHFPRYRRGGDFIRSCIFPGGMLPSPSRFHAEAEKAGLAVKDKFCFGPDYARTLSCWLDNFDGAHDHVKELGFDDHFIRLWRFYLAACIAGFQTGRTDVMQVELCHA